MICVQLSCSANITRWLSDVPHPTVWVVILFVSWICDFEVLDLEARNIIHWDFKIHRDRSYFLPALGGNGACKSYLRDHVVFYSSLEFLDGPFRLFFRRFVLVCLPLYSLWQLKRHICCRSRYWELYYYLSRKVIWRELSSHLHRKLKFILRHLIYEGVNAERSWVLSVDSIIHYKELTVWWLNRHSFHCFKVAYVHTLVEVAVIEHYTTHWTSWFFSYREIIIEDKSQLWVSLEIAFHLNYSINGGINHHPVSIE